MRFMNYPSVKSRKNIMKINRIAAVLSLIIIFGLSVFGQKMTVVDDPTIDTKERSKATAAEEKLVKSLLPKARRIWNDESCTEDFSITGWTLGAFTRKDAAQKVFLYEFCQTGNGFANDGIVITENGKIVAHFIYEGAWTAGLIGLPDINGNGIDELMIENYGGMHQGITGTGIDIIEISGGGKSVKEIGATQSSYDDSDADENGKSKNAYSYKISVKTGATPIFYREKFVQKGKTWRKIGATAKAEMFKLDYKYDLLK